MKNWESENQKLRIRKSEIGKQKIINWKNSEITLPAMIILLTGVNGGAGPSPLPRLEIINGKFALMGFHSAWEEEKIFEKTQNNKKLNQFP